MADLVGLIAPLFGNIEAASTDLARLKSLRDDLDDALRVRLDQLDGQLQRLARHLRAFNRAALDTDALPPNYAAPQSLRDAVAKLADRLVIAKQRLQALHEPLAGPAATRRVAPMVAALDDLFRFLINTNHVLDVAIDGLPLTDSASVVGALPSHRHWNALRGAVNAAAFFANTRAQQVTSEAPEGVGGVDTEPLRGESDALRQWDQVLAAVNAAASLVNTHRQRVGQTASPVENRTSRVRTTTPAETSDLRLGNGAFVSSATAGEGHVGHALIGPQHGSQVALSSSETGAAHADGSVNGTSQGAKGPAVGGASRPSTGSTDSSPTATQQVADSLTATSTASHTTISFDPSLSQATSATETEPGPAPPLQLAQPSLDVEGTSNVPLFVSSPMPPSAMVGTVPVGGAPNQSLQLIPTPLQFDAHLSSIGLQQHMDGTTPQRPLYLAYPMPAPGHTVTQAAHADGGAAQDGRPRAQIPFHDRVARPPQLNLRDVSPNSWGLSSPPSMRNIDTPELPALTEPPETIAIAKYVHDQLYEARANARRRTIVLVAASDTEHMLQKKAIQIVTKDVRCTLMERRFPDSLYEMPMSLVGKSSSLQSAEHRVVKLLGSIVKLRPNMHEIAEQLVNSGGLAGAVETARSVFRGKSFLLVLHDVCKAPGRRDGFLSALSKVIADAPYACMLVTTRDQDLVGKRGL